MPRLYSFRNFELRPSGLEIFLIPSPMLLRVFTHTAGSSQSFLPRRLSFLRVHMLDMFAMHSHNDASNDASGRFDAATIHVPTLSFIAYTTSADVEFRNPKLEALNPSAY